MTCPLCQIEVPDTALIAHPYWQDLSLELAHKMNPEWREEDGCCKLCFDRIMDTVETAWVPAHNYVIRGVSEGYRYVLTKRESGNWNPYGQNIQPTSKLLDSLLMR